MAVDGDKHGVAVDLRRADPVDEEVVGHARQLLDLPPRRAAILRHLDHPIVRARVDQPLDQRRLAEGGDCREHRHRAVVPQRVGAPGAPHDRLRQAEDAAREVRADRLPRIAAVVAAPDVLGCVVDARVRVRADDDGRVPVEAERGIGRAGLRADVDRLVALAVVAEEVAFLPLEVDRVRVGGVDRDRVAVGAVGDRPVEVRDAVPVERARRPHLAAVVLRAAVHVVERQRIVEGQLVELRDGQVLEEAPRLAAVVRFVHAAVAAVEDVVSVARHERHRVVVAVLVLLGHAHERLAAVVRHHQARVHLVDAVERVRVGEDLLVVVRAGAAADERTALLETLALVRRAVEPALVGRGLDRRVDDTRVDRGDGEADLPDVALRQADLELSPRLARVLALVDGRFGAAAHERSHGAPALIRGGIQDVRVRRVHLGRRHARVLRDLERDHPRLPAVSGLVEAALAARRPQRPLRGGIHDERVARIDQDAGDVLRVLEPHVRPRLAAVQALVDAVAVAHVAPAHVFAGAHPHGLGIGRVQRDAPNRVRALRIEDRRPCRAGVLRLPHASRPDRHVPRGAPLRVNDDVADAARHDGRPDVAELEAGEEVGGDERRRRGGLRRRLGGLRGPPGRLGHRAWRERQGRRSGFRRRAFSWHPPGVGANHIPARRP